MKPLVVLRKMMRIIIECTKCQGQYCKCGEAYTLLTKRDRIDIAAAILGILPDQISDIGIPNNHPAIHDWRLEVN